MTDFKLMTSATKRKLRSDTNPDRKRLKIDYEMARKVKPRKIGLSNMPNEILLEIFSYLPHDDLLNATLVNRNWSYLISNSKKTMCKINKLHIDDQNIHESLPKLTRCYEKIVLEDICEWRKELFDCLKEIASSVKTIVVAECVFFDNDFKALVDCFKNLEYLEVWDCHPGLSPVSNNYQENTIHMNSLKSLMLRGYSWPLRLISTPNLEYFEAESMTLYDQEWLISFLNQQKKLNSLHLIDMTDLFDSRFGQLNVQFEQLRELVLYDLPHIDHNQFFSMLSRVKSSVVAVDIGYDTRRDIAEFILTNFEALISLSIDYDCLPNHSRFYNRMRQNFNLKSVAIYGCMKSSRPVLQFLNTHPGIEILKMKALSNLHSTKFTFWSEFSKATRNVCCLGIGNLEPFNMVYMKSTKLKHLDVDFVGQISIESWIDFCKNNPCIEHFHIFRKHKNLSQKVQEVLIKNLPRLKEITFESSN